MFHPYSRHEKTAGYNQGCFSQIYKRRRICKNPLQVIILKMKTKMTILLLIDYTREVSRWAAQHFWDLIFATDFHLYQGFNII
ncbi:MAG: hypothetical protein EA394_05715 [Bacteroidia bacterium]|nr:MAG: hypothetical protein EA394_05715 [Bacteroidia bacterium]